MCRLPLSVREDDWSDVIQCLSGHSPRLSTGHPSGLFLHCHHKMVSVRISTLFLCLYFYLFFLGGGGLLVVMGNSLFSLSKDVNHISHTELVWFFYFTSIYMYKQIRYITFIMHTFKNFVSPLHVHFYSTSPTTCLV